LLQKQTRGNSVNAELKLRYGSEASLTAKPAVASLTAAMLERGTKAHTYAQIRDAFDEGAGVFLRERPGRAAKISGAALAIP
jgi:zinc protease